ncbi:MAG: aryl-sulfate sulfotransferase [Actinobacteria bacterium]|nr:aryl-sulfate sulfotransferase [Actinomycetota bacterium]
MPSPRTYTAVAALVAAGAVAITTTTVLDRDDAAIVVRVAVDADPDNPLIGEVTLALDEPAAAALLVHAPDGIGWRVTSERPADDVSFPLLGLRPDTTYQLIAVIGEERTDLGEFATGSLPEHLPPMQAAVSEPGGMEPGLTLFNLMYEPPEGEDGIDDRGFLVAVDEAGEIVWYFQQEQAIEDVRRTEDGSLLFIHDETGVRDIAPTGELIGEWSGATALDVATEDESGRPVTTEDVIRVETDQMHHEVVELDSGNLLTLSRELREIEFPEPICDEAEVPFDGTYDVVGDTVVEFEPDTGAIVSEVSMFDLIDPLEILDRVVVPEWCGPYLERRYPDQWPVHDWTHANAVVLDEERNALLVSNRHTDTVDAIRYEDDEDGPAGELLWRLGEAGDFTLQEGGEWFYHQHAPQVLPDGSILIYDNGNRRVGTDLEDPERLPYSRAVIYELDEEAMTARQVWEHKLPPTEDGEPIYAPFVGDADAQPGGTVLITHGGLVHPPSHAPLISWARIVEVERDSGELVFDLTIREVPDGPGWAVYRAERIPTLYPDGYTVEPLDARA